mgnify:CR=1 FL=1
MGVNVGSDRDLATDSRMAWILVDGGAKMTNHRVMILKLSCPDRPGLVASMSNFIAEEGGNILEMSQFTDPVAKWFFVRIEFSTESQDDAEQALIEKFCDFGNAIGADWQFSHPMQRKPVAILVTKAAHCLQDLLARTWSGELPVDVRVILGNREDLKAVADRYEIPFQHIPVPKEDKAPAFKQYQEAIAESGADLVVLARFMQILPADFCAAHHGRMINIHHSFLPAFIGANPYRQAFKRGVKIIGATAHYVTSDLDAGPIIDQEVARVEHYHTPEDLMRLGRDCECLALSRAVRFHANDRILVHGNKTIVFRD